MKKIDPQRIDILKKKHQSQYEEVDNVILSLREKFDFLRNVDISYRKGYLSLPSAHPLIKQQLLIHFAEIKIFFQGHGVELRGIL